jgi:hypothetical protein
MTGSCLATFVRRREAKHRLGEFVEGIAVSGVLARFATAIGNVYLECRVVTVHKDPLGPLLHAAHPKLMRFE